MSGQIIRPNYKTDERASLRLFGCIIAVWDASLPRWQSICFHSVFTRAYVSDSEFN